jgi:phenylpropionate dioxygenase-like ring-hydroxylating dioxygenase large terminal subunit
MIESPTTGGEAQRGEPGASNAERYASAEYFAAEMQALAAACWQFFCTTDDLADNNDWVRRRVFGTDVFVQNFRGDLRGYHNVCQHRGFPLRREPQGNGIVLCGFHAWTYNQEGVPLGVARNDELFSFTREQKVELALPKVRVAVVGRLVFVALLESVPEIDDYLGRYGALFRAISAKMRSPRHRWSGSTRANWKLCYEVTLDDYHLTSVHPSSNWDVPAWGCFYEREGPHSHLLRRRTADWQFPTFWDDVSRGEYETRGYKIHHTFPNLLLSVAPGTILLTTYSPREVTLTEVEDLAFDMDGGPDDDLFWAEFAAGHRQVSDEDRAVVESQQEAIAQFARRPVLGALEQRVGWFLESYETLVGGEARRRLSSGR